MKKNAVHFYDTNVLQDREKKFKKHVFELGIFNAAFHVTRRKTRKFEGIGEK